MKIALAALALLGTLLLPTQALAGDAWIIKDAVGTVPDTVARLTAAVEAAGAKVVAVVDHAAGAKVAGAEIPPATLVIFGNPKLGTPIIAADPKAGLDLPIRVLVWDDAGKTRIGYLDPAVLKSRYQLDNAGGALTAITGALDKLTTKAAAP
jgi:uncharacterized protein (DUF302 family)